jgi:serine/threonine-protein kinase
MAIQLETGMTIAGRYRLVRPLGEGGIGVVWESWQTGVERRVAIKFLKVSPADELRQRFELEARALGRLNHPNCVTIHDFGHTGDDMAFLVMEYLDGEPATAWRMRKLPVSDIVAIGQQIATALAYAHYQGVVHRDLKPENVFAVESFSGEQLIKVLDFGLAKLTGRQPQDITQTGQIFGTPAYMSPEQLRGTRDAGPASDLYSLGVMLFELVEGRLPFSGTSPFKLGMAHISEPIPHMHRDVDPRLKEIVRTLMAKKPGDRYPNALSVFDALEEVEVRSADSTLRLVLAENPHETLSRMPSPFADEPRVSVDATTEPDIVDSTLTRPAQQEAANTIDDNAPSIHAPRSFEPTPPAEVVPDHSTWVHDAPRQGWAQASIAGEEPAASGRSVPVWVAAGAGAMVSAAIFAAVLLTGGSNDGDSTGADGEEVVTETAESNEPTPKAVEHDMGNAAAFGEQIPHEKLPSAGEIARAEQADDNADDAEEPSVETDVRKSSSQRKRSSKTRKPKTTKSKPKPKEPKARKSRRVRKRREEAAPKTSSDDSGSAKIRQGIQRLNTSDDVRSGTLPTPSVD